MSTKSKEELEAKLRAYVGVDVGPPWVASSLPGIGRITLPEGRPGCNRPDPLTVPHGDGRLRLKFPG